MNESFRAFWAAIFRRLLPSVFGYEVHGLENVPRGPALIVSNHLSVFDPPATIMALLRMRPPRHVYFLAKKSLYDIRIAGFPWVGFLLDRIEAIPLNQDEADLTAFKRALKLLGEGKMVGIYPEGGITWTHEPKPAAPGLALLAHLAQVPVIPLGITGTRPLWWRDEHGRRRFNRMCLRFGGPIAPPPKGRMSEEARRLYTQTVMDECYRLVAVNLGDERLAALTPPVG